MEGTPKIKKRSCLSLGKLQKRDASSHIPQTAVFSKSGNSFAIDVDNYNKEYKYVRRPKSPPYSSISTHSDVACTPPHKKFNMDDSVEYSPRFCDSINSPSCLLSQTLTSNSPEVGWKWGRRSDEQIVEAPAVTPDSAYAADSSFTSVGSSSTERKNGLCSIRRESYTQRLTYEKQKEEQRRKFEIEMRRAEKLRADELLKQRCAKLEEQLKEAEKRRKQDIERTNTALMQCQLVNNLQEIKATNTRFEGAEDLAAIEDIFNNTSDDFDDFFNDSAADGILLEATQQLESKMVELSQKSSKEICVTEITSDMSHKNEDISSKSTKLANASPALERQEKRSSLYMKFLEDDSPDDWFLSLDDVILQATQQAKKPRNSFQRHNSMPINTVMHLGPGSAGVINTITSMTSETGATSRGVTSSTITSSVNSSPKIKRHASSHAFNSTSGAISSYHDRQIYGRK